LKFVAEANKNYLRSERKAASRSIISLMKQRLIVVVALASDCSEFFTKIV